jgi:hypothetical protein
MGRRCTDVVPVETTWEAAESECLPMCLPMLLLLVLLLKTCALDSAPAAAGQHTPLTHPPPRADAAGGACACATGRTGAGPHEIRLLAAVNSKAN